MKISYKLSYYIITTTNSINSDIIIYSTRTCKLITISSYCYQLLENKDFSAIPDDLTMRLLSYKVIVPADEIELPMILTENNQEIEDIDVLSEIIQPSANCQLGCYYCGQQHNKHQLTDDVAERIIQRVRDKCASEIYKHLKIAWFGGEPLMALQQVRVLSKAFIEMTEQFGMTYSAAMVSNGLSLKENIFKELATKWQISTIDITLDGIAEYHDQHRYVKGGGSSFDMIYNNLKSILSQDDFKSMGCDITIRCNVDEKNHAGVSDFISFIANDPIFSKVSSFYFAGIYSWGGNNAHKQSLEKSAFAKNEIFWKLEMIDKGLPNTFKLPERKKSVCTAVKGDKAEMIDAYGNIFNCTEVSYSSFYEKSSYNLGNIRFDTFAKFDNKPLEDWNEVLLTDKFPCHKCRLLPVCGGQCPKKWYEDEPACPPFKFNIKEKMELIYLFNKVGKPELSERIDCFRMALNEKELLAYR